MDLSRDFIEKHLTSTIDFTDYLSKLNQHLFESISQTDKHFAKSFLWSALTFYKNDQKKLVTSRITTHPEYIHLKPLISSLSDWLSKGIALNVFQSFTTLILNEIYQNGILFEISGKQLGAIFEKKITPSQLLKSVEIPNIDANSNEIKKIFKKTPLETITDDAIKKLIPFFSTYKLIADIDEIEKNFLYLLPETYYSEKFKGLYFVCLRQSDKPNNNWLNLAQLYLHKFFSIDYIKEIKNQESIALSQSRKSAISAVMSRNMSHNIGSHVLASLLNEDNVQTELVKSFLKYMQTRMEFIADIITTEAAVTFPSNFHDDINSGFFSDDLQKHHKWPLYLLRYISGSKEVTYDNSLKQQQNIHISYPGTKDVMVAVPNDIMGAQAFYIILENIIRNSVKHSAIPTLEYPVSNAGVITLRRKKQLNLSIQIDTSFEHPDLLKVVIWDDLGQENLEERKHKQYIIKETTENIEENKSFINWLNYKLHRPIIDNTGKLRQNDWGLLEMKICAAYLRKYPLVNLDEDTSPPLFKVVTDAQYNLGFELYLLKPKLACFIVSELPSGRNVTHLAKLGIDLVKASEADLDSLFLYGLLKTKTESHTASHQFLIIEKDLEFKEKYPSSNQPTLRLSKKEIQDLINMENAKDIHLDILQKFAKNAKRAIKLLDIETMPPLTGEDAIFFDDHGNCRMEHLATWPESSVYYEPYGSQSPTNQLLQKWKNTSATEKEILEYEFNLAASLKVGILDERIQAEVEKKAPYIKTKTSREVLLEMNVFIPSIEKEFDLYDNDYFERKDKSATTSQKIKDWLSKNMHTCDYLIIHQGVIEKAIKDTDPEAIKGFINAFENGRAQIIVISGRGKPSNLPQDAFYLPFSLVNQYVITYRSKIYLYKLLIAARRYHG